MALTYVYLAASDQVAGTSGKFFDEKNRILRVDHTKQPANIDELMQATRRYLEKGKTS